MDTKTEPVVTSQNVLKTKIDNLMDLGYDLANNLEDVLMRGGEPKREDKDTYIYFLKCFRNIYRRTIPFIEKKDEGVSKLGEVFDANIQPKADYLLKTYYAYMELLKGVGLYPKITEKGEWK